VTYSGTKYFYLKNAQGDILGLVDTSGNQVVAYTYDAWGKLLTSNGSLASTLGKANPFRYRGYVYDEETGLYYVSSRYYDPETCRFLNADSVISGTGKSVQGYNLFEYCNNNPVNKSDSTGAWPNWINNAASAITTAAKKVASAVTNAVNSIKSSFSPVNHVEKTHVTTPTAMLDLGTLFGKVGFSSTVTKQDKEPGLVHSASDIGNDASKYSAGINIVGWLGADVGVSSEINAFVSAQVTPWVHGEVSAGIDGIGAVIGFDVGDTSFDFELKGGWGLIAIFIAPQLIASGGQPSTATT